MPFYTWSGLTAIWDLLSLCYQFCLCPAQIRLLKTIGMSFRRQCSSRLIRSFPLSGAFAPLAFLQKYNSQYQKLKSEYDTRLAFYMDHRTEEDIANEEKAKGKGKRGSKGEEKKKKVRFLACFFKIFCQEKVATLVILSLCAAYDCRIDKRLSVIVPNLCILCHICLCSFVSSRTNIMDLRTQVKDPNAPKRPLSGYMFFTKAIRPELQNMSVTEQAKELGARWAMLSDAQKEVGVRARVCSCYCMVVIIIQS